MNIYVTTVLKPHGIMGKFKVKYFDEEMQNIVLENIINDSVIDYKVSNIEGIGSGFLIFTVDQINSYEKAVNLIGKDLYINRKYLSNLKFNEYYVSDLIGNEVFLQDGTFYGTIINIHDFGAGDIVEIQLKSNDSIMLPFDTDVFLDNDLITKKAIIKLPKFIDE